MANSFIDVSTGLLEFNYQEYLSNGDKFNQESGFIHGFSGGYSYITDQISWHLNASHYKGYVDYTGQTQAGSVLNTTTDTILTDISTELSWYPISDSLGVYTQVQWHEWQRRIQPSNHSLALYEVYQWQNYEAGFVSTLFQNNNTKLKFKFGLSHSKNGQLNIDLSKVGYGKPSLDLGDGSGVAASLSYHISFSNKNVLSFNLSHKQWKFSESDSKTIYGKSTPLKIREPRSKSQRTQLSLSYHFNLSTLL